MRNTDMSKTLDKLEKLSHKKSYDELKKYPVKTLELLAMEMYNKSFKDKRFRVLDAILFERANKLDSNFEWTDENKQKFLNVNNKIMQAFVSTYNEALSVANELENRIKNGDKFLKDYEIEITITPYIYKDDDDDICYVLSEPVSGFLPMHLPIIGNSSYNSKVNEKPIYLDESLNWNIEYFGDTFNNDYICYGIHELLDTHRWSFIDIVNINKIHVDVEVIHQHHIDI